MTGIALRFFACMISVPLAAWLLPGVHVQAAEAAWIAGALLATVYLLIRPLLRLLLSALNCLLLGVLGIFTDSALVLLCAHLLEGFSVDGILWAGAAALMIGVLRTGADFLTEKKKKKERKHR